MSNHRKISVLKTIVILLLCLSMAQSAFAGTLTLPGAVKAIEEEAFYGDESLDEVVLPSQIQTIGAKAFSKSSLSKINLPDSLYYIAENAFDKDKDINMTATPGTYAWNWAVNNDFIEDPNIPGTQITSAVQDGMGTVKLTWNDMGEGYTYRVFRYTDKGLKLVAVSEINTVSFSIADQGKTSFAVQGTRRENDGSIATGKLSQAYQINIQYIWMYDISITRINQTGNSEATIVWRGVAPADYYQIAEYVNGSYQILANHINANQDVYTLDHLQPGIHRYAIRAAWQDPESNDQYVSCWSAIKSMNTISEMEYALTAPMLLFDDPEKAFTAQENNAPIYNPGTIDVNWENIQDATYSVVLEQKIGSGYQTITSQSEIENTFYRINGNMFSGITAQTTYRFGISAKKQQSSDIQYSYFKVKPVASTLLIDGKTSARWERTMKTGGTRTFAVTSELAWTATANVDWITVYPGSDAVDLRVSDNPNYTGYRSGKVTVTNGVTSRTISVYQGVENDPPQVKYGDKELSTDAAHPSTIPAGPFTIALDKGVALVQYVEIYKKTSSGYGSTPVYKFTTNDAYEDLPADCGFTTGDELWIRSSGHMSLNDANYSKYETAGDSPIENYYVRLVNDGAFLLIEGEDSYSMTTYTGGIVKIFSSNVFDVVSDSPDWLTYSVRSSTNELDIDVVDNATGSSRTGHITVSSGPRTAILTVTQPDTTPKVIAPTNLSRNASSPTDIGAGLLRVEAYGTKLSLNAKSGSGWATTNELYETLDDEVITVVPIEPALMEKGITYRLRISDESGRTSDYYIKRSTVSSNNAYFNQEDMKVPAGASTQTVSITTSGKWTLTSDSSWLTVTPSSGSSQVTKKEITIKPAANTTGKQRTATLSLKTGSVLCAQIKITQAATDSVFVTYDNKWPANTADILNHVNGKGDILFLNAYAPGKMSVTSSVSWLTLKETSIEPGDQFSVTVAQNTTSSNRTGKITIACGNSQQVVSITQVPTLATPALTSPTLGTSSASPSALKHDGQGMTVKWNKVANAVQYSVSLKFMVGNKSYKHVITVENKNTSTYSVSLPAEWFSTDYTGVYDLIIRAYDQYGYSYISETYYFTRMGTDAALINGEKTLTWQNVTDLGASKDFSIVSSGNWTATSSAAWIHLGASSGTNGAVLNISVDQNIAEGRTGTVTIRSGSGSAVLTVSQCPLLSQYPVIKSPALGTKPNPAVLGKTNTLTLTWDWEPQVRKYRIEMYRVLSDSTERFLMESDPIRENGSYTIDTSSLQEGQIYGILFIRDMLEDGNDRPGITDAEWYFVFQPTEPFIRVEKGDGGFVNERTNDFEPDGDENSAYYKISSSGTWMATVSDSSWILVGKKRIRESTLIEEGLESSEYARMFGNSGDNLCISVLKNNSGDTREGTVSITTSGGVSKTIHVVQGQYYALPQITSPALATSPSASAILPFSDISLSWTSGEGNIGEYSVILSEKEGGYYYKIYEKNMSGRRLTIPGAILKENTEYRIRLETTLENSGFTDGNNYYFHTGCENELTLNISVDWEGVTLGGYININASASGGSGGYKFAYELFKDGRKEQETNWETLKYYQFKPKDKGNYQVRVSVKDSTGNQVLETEDYYIDNTNALSVVIANEYNASLDAKRQFLDYTVVSNGKWNLLSIPTWVTASVTEGVNGTEIRFVVENNNGMTRTGIVVISSSTGIQSRLIIRQSANSDFILDEWEREVSAYACTVTNTIEAANSWTAGSGDDWLTVSCTRGSSGTSTISVSIKENAGNETRTGTILFTCNDSQYEYRIRQAGKSGGGGEPSPELNISFTLSATEIIVGEKLTADVYASDASAVQLVMDDAGYDIYPVENGQVHVERVISKAGKRKIQFRRFDGDEWGEISVPQTLTVNEYGKLNAPRIVLLNNEGFTGEEYTFSIGRVNHADSYYVRIYKPGTANESAIMLTDEELSSNSLISIPAIDLLEAGEYGISVIATGMGYSQSETTATFRLSNRNYDVLLLTPEDGGEFVVGDTFHIRAAHSEGFIGIRVSGPDGDHWYPEDGTQLVADADYLLDIPVETAGTYQITAFVFPINTPVDSNHAVASSNTSTLTVLGPVIRSVYVGSKTKYYTWIEPKDGNEVTITTNNAVDQVYVTEDGIQYSTEYKGETNFLREYVYPLKNQGQGLHVLSIIAEDSDVKDKNGENLTTNTTRSFYVAKPISSSYDVYPTSDNLRLVSSPINGSFVADVQGGEWIEPLKVIHEADDWYRVQNRSGQKGFIKVSSTSKTQPTGMNARIQITWPVAGTTVSRNENQTVEVEWRSSLIIPDLSKITITIASTSDPNKKATVYGVPELYINSVDVSGLSDGMYTATIAYNAAGNSVTDSVQFILGSYDQSKEDLQAYRKWFNEKILNRIISYKNNFGKTYISRDSSNMILSLRKAYEFLPYVRDGYIESNGVRLSFGDNYLNLFNDYRTSEYATLEEEDRKKIDIAILGDMLREEGTRDIILHYNMDNIPESIEASEDASQHKAIVDMIFSSVSVIYNSIIASADAVKLSGGNLTNADIESGKIKKFLKDLAETAYDYLKLMTEETVKEYDAMLLTEAYKKEYCRVIKLVCEDYVDYLEMTVFGGKGKSSKKQPPNMDRREASAYQFIQAYKKIVNSSNKELEDEAISDLLTYAFGTSSASGRMLDDGNGKINVDLISEYSHDFRAFLIEYLKQPDIWETIGKQILKDILKIVFEAKGKEYGFDVVPANALTNLIDDLADCVIDHSGKFNANFYDDMHNTLTSKLAGYAWKGSAEMVLKGIIYSNIQEMFTMGTKSLMHAGLSPKEQQFWLKESVQSTNELKKNCAETIREMISAAWEAGKSGDELIQSAASLIADLNGLTLYEEYASRFADTMTYRSLFMAKTLFFTDNFESEVKNMGIPELEKLRQSTITLINNDKAMFTYLLNMRTINEDNEWKFRPYRKVDNNEEYYDNNTFPTETQLKTVISELEKYEKEMMTIPKAIQEIIK